jgi:hypothetical protein
MWILSPQDGTVIGCTAGCAVKYSDVPYMHDDPAVE